MTAPASPEPYICRHGAVYPEHWCDDMGDYGIARPEGTPDLRETVVELLARIRCPHGAPEKVLAAWDADTQRLVQVVGDLAAERDEARAALDRVRALCDEADADADAAINDYEGHRPAPVVTAWRLRAAMDGEQ